MNPTLLYENAERTMELARRARSLKGRQIPEALIKTLGDIAFDGFDLIIGSQKNLSKKFVFFLQNHSHLDFYTQYGEKFNFTDYADPVKYREPFMAIDFERQSKRGQVFMFFPTDEIVL